MVEMMVERWVDIHGRGHLRTVAAEVTVVAVVIDCGSIIHIHHGGGGVVHLAVAGTGMVGIAVDITTSDARHG